MAVTGTFDRFDIERLVGSGGMATVYRAVDRQTGEPVALKVLHGRTTEQTERFEQEAELLAELSHPAIVRYVGHGTTPVGERYLAMEWLDGQTLEDALASGPLTIGQSVDLGRRVAEALASAHRRGIVHRDIKPGNLILPGGALPGVRVLDFGLARRVLDQRRITQSGGIMGTPMYMAPEQARGEPYIDARADIFALGCVLFQCLTGQPPFTGPTAMAVLAKICLDEPVSVRELCPGLPPDLEQFLTRMLAKERGARPPDATGVAVELQRIAERLADAEGKPAPAPGSTTMRIERGALTSGEQRVVCVVLVTRPKSGAAGTTSAAPRTLELPGDAAAAAALAARPPLETETIILRTDSLFDPEDVDQLRAALQPYGARLERLLDGSMVVSLSGRGAPTDQATAAAHCALVLRGALPDAALSIATGRAVIFGRLPVGDVIDRGAEMLRGAVPGVVRLDEVTADLLGARFEIAGAGGSAEGDAGARRTLVGERQRGDRPRTVLGKTTACVGRERELDLLEGTFEECVEEPVARAVLVTAPAGGGKSRLRHELLDRLRRGRRRFELLVGRADAIGSGSPFALLAPAVRGAAGIASDEPEARAREKLSARVGRHLAGDAARRAAEFLGELVGVSFPADESPALLAARADPRLMGDQLRAAWLDWLAAECDAGPVLLVLDDVHWGDRPSLQFVEAALRALRERPFMVLAFARPDLDEVFPGLWRERDVQRVTLRGLTRRASRELVQQVLGDGLDDETMSWLLERADGNPFYLEELIRAVATGARASLPETVLGMVQARLDALGEDPRRVLRAASVFGETFTRAGVSALLSDRDRQILPMCLDVLVTRELVSPREGGGADGDGDADASGREFVFRHALLRDAAYAMLTEGDRALGHLLAAEFLEKSHARDAIVLVEHFERGGDAARAATFCRDAAAEALEASDLGAAIARARRGAELGAAGDLLGRLHLIEAQAQFWRGEYVLAEAAATAAAQIFDGATQPWFEALGELVTALGQQGKYPEVSRWANVASAMRAADEARVAQRRCLIRAAAYLLPGGRYEAVEAILARVAAESDQFATLEPVAAAKVHAVRAARALHAGDQAAAISLYEQALAAAAAAGDARAVAEMHGNLAATWADLGQLDQAEAGLRQALADAERLELGHISVWALLNLGTVLTGSGRLDEARRVLTTALEFGRKQGDQRLEGAALLYLSTVQYLAGDLRDSESRARMASEILPTPLQPAALAALARAVLAAGRVKEALQHARMANELLATIGHVEDYESLVRLVLAEALAAAGEVEPARAALRAAHDRLMARAEQIANADWRAAFLTRNLDNARTVRVAREWGLV
ncbi:MAG TPA: protein kinase [Polyangia bacterium]|nr:protein kinase [Polyangia bacterium]